MSVRELRHEKEKKKIERNIEFLKKRYNFREDKRRTTSKIKVGHVEGKRRKLIYRNVYQFT